MCRLQCTTVVCYDLFFFFNDTATTEIYTLSLHDALPIFDYVTDYYSKDGEKYVAQISTFGTMASKAAIKDVGRALEMPYADVDKIAKMIPPPVRGRNVSIGDAIKQNPDLKRAINSDERLRDLIEIAQSHHGS